MCHSFRWLRWTLFAVLGSTCLSRAQVGTYAWAVSAGGARADVGRQVGVDAAGNVYMAGLFRGTAQFVNLTLTAQTDMADIYLAKYNPQGQVLWVRQAGGPNIKSVQAMTVDSVGNVVLTGDFTAAQFAPALSAASTLTFDQLVLTSGSIYGEMYLVQYDTQGQVRWATQTVGRWQSGTSCGGQDLATDPDGSIYLAGYYGGAGVRFNQTVATTAPNATHFLAKYDHQGALVWLRGNLGSGQGTFASSPQVAVSPTHQVYLLALFNAAVTLGTTTLPSPSRVTPYYLATLDGQGNFLRVQQEVLTPQEACRDLAVSPRGNLVATCTYEGTVTHGNQRFTSVNGPNPLTLSFSSLGEFQWGQTTSSSQNQGSEQITPVAFDVQGNSYTVLANEGDLVVSYAPTGTLRWSMPSPLLVTGIAVSAPDQVVLTGQYEGHAVFGATTLTDVGEVDAFLAKLDVRGVALPPPSPEAQFIPNIITPNNDGLNDRFQILGLPTGPWQLRVYSRWGRLVYQSEDYQQDWSATGVSDGHYLYYLRGPVQPAVQGWLDVVH